MSFSNFDLSKSLLNELSSQKFEKIFPIQKEAIPAILESKDVLGIAQTGSGKTLSFVLPILSNLQGVSKGANREPKVLVLVPTRELAEQVKDVFQDFSYTLEDKVKILAVYGGVSINAQMQSMNNVTVLVATPGRLLDLINSNALHLGSVSTLVIDEADKMLNLGFKDEMDKIFSLLPNKRQNLLFSATLNEDVEQINQILLDNPVVIKIQAEEQNLDLIEQLAYYISEDKKGPLLRHLIRTKKFKQVLVFTASTYKADNVADKLRKNGIEATAIHSKKSQGSRTDALKKFKAGSIKVLVATDLLARGIDVIDLPAVINYELPRSPKDYVHRIGRTGRAGNKGEAISLIVPNDEHHFKIIQKKMKKLVDRIDGNQIDLK